MKPWQLGDGDNTVATEQLRMEFIFDSINRQLAAIGVTDQTTFNAFASYIGYSTGGTPSYQDMQVVWTPTNTKLGEAIGFATFGDIPQDTITFDCVTSINGFSITQTSTPKTFSAPNLTSVDPNVGDFVVSQNTGLTVINCPLLASAYEVDCSQNTALTTVHFESLSSTIAGVHFNNTLIASLDLSALVTVGGDLIASNCPNLITVLLPVFLPTNGKSVNFSGGNLDAASVNLILARGVANAGYVSGLIDLTGGTNAAPTGQGIIDKATLNARLPGLADTN